MLQEERQTTRTLIRILRILDVIVAFLILMNVAVIILESFEVVRLRFERFIHIFEYVTVGLFSLEYIYRIIIEVYIGDKTERKLKRIFRFIVSPLGIIDMLAILPFYVAFFVDIDFRLLQIFRLVRILWLLKLRRYFRSLRVIDSVVREKSSELRTVFFSIFFILLISSAMMYYIEGPHQPENFPNILASLWWAVITLTTVGYGDVYPVTDLGKIISGLLALTGIGIVALPAAILSASFIDHNQDSKKKKFKYCPHCGEKLSEK